MLRRCVINTNASDRLQIDRRQASSSSRVDIRQRLARILRRLRIEKGWSQERYPDEAGIHRTYVSDIKRGARNPTIAIVEKLTAPFGVPVGSLLD